jgi:uncharacterized protein (DUF952 family)
MDVIMDRILHICPADDWNKAITDGLYRATSLATEGFIHCSKPEQILDVANRYFPGVGGLVLLWLDPGKLTAELRYEISEGDVYPHVYGPLNLEAVFAVTKISPESDGVFRTLPKPD